MTNSMKVKGIDFEVTEKCIKPLGHDYPRYQFVDNSRLFGWYLFDMEETAGVVPVRESVVSEEPTEAEKVMLCEDLMRWSSFDDKPFKGMPYDVYQEIGW